MPTHKYFVICLAYCKLSKEKKLKYDSTQFEVSLFLRMRCLTMVGRA